MMNDDWYTNAVKLSDLIRTHKGRIVIYTGAGISTSANIPDYRGTNGLWVRNKRPRRSDSPGQNELCQAVNSCVSLPEEACETSCSKSEVSEATGGSSIPNSTKPVPMKLRLPEATMAKPTFTHMAIKTLVVHGYVRHVISQNVDGLHMRSGLPREKLSELHGNLFLEQCVACGSIVKRRFDVAENTSRGHHLTGRICPACRLQKPAECFIVNLNLCSAVEKVIHRKGHLKSPRKAFMLAQKSAALKLLRARRRGDPNLTPPPDSDGSTDFPLLRDVVVHFYERQPEMGLAEIYRVAAAIQAVHGRKPLQDSIRFCLAQDNPGAQVDRNAEPPCQYLIHSPWFKRMLPAFRANPFLSPDLGADSPTPGGTDSCATLIIVLGSSLQVLRNYAFLWPQGLGRCISERTSRKSPKKIPGTSQSDLPNNDALSSPKTDRCILAIVNLQPTCKDGIADVVIHAPCDVVLEVIMSECLRIPVPEYMPERDDPLFSEATLLDPDEEHTRTRPDIPFECFTTPDHTDSS